RRRTTMTTMLNEIPGVICPLPEGAFYCYPSVKGVLGKELAGARPGSTTELAEVILEHADVAVVPGEAFGTPGYFRLSCALGDADLEEGLARMHKLLDQAKQARPPNATRAPQGALPPALHGAPAARPAR